MWHLHNRHINADDETTEMQLRIAARWERCAGNPRRMGEALLLSIYGLDPFDLGEMGLDQGIAARRLFVMEPYLAGMVNFSDEDLRLLLQPAHYWLRSFLLTRYHPETGELVILDSDPAAVESLVSTAIHVGYRETWRDGEQRSKVAEAKRIPLTSDHTVNGDTPTLSFVDSEIIPSAMVARTTKRSTYVGYSHLVMGPVQRNPHRPEAPSPRSVIRFLQEDLERHERPELVGYLLCILLGLLDLDATDGLLDHMTGGRLTSLLVDSLVSAHTF